jgi:hypothetical protein
MGALGAVAFAAVSSMELPPNWVVTD